MIEIECEQGTEAWAEPRRGIATASCADRIITPKTGELSSQSTDYACELIAQSMLPAHYWKGEDYQSSAMANGTRTEREARDYLEMQLGRDVRQVGFCLTDDKRFGCSPDGLIDPHEGVELKCPEHKKQIRYLVDGVLPPAYRPQVHFSMVVTKRPAWWFMSYAVGLPPLLIRVQADEYTLKVAEAMESFWKLLTDLRAKIEAGGDPVAATREPYNSPF
jgi:hypothetical protein